MSELTGTGELQQRIRDLEKQVFALRQENQDLYQNEERYRALFERAADYILILSEGAGDIPVIVDLNEAACVVHGYTREELLGRPISFLDSSETQKNIPERVRRVLGSGKPETFEAVHTCADGRLITVEVTATPVVVAGKSYIYAIERDITARKRSEAVLRFYEQIIATSGEHMSLLDRHYVYQAVNETYLAAHQISREKIVGHGVAEVLGQETFDKVVRKKLDQCLAGVEVHYRDWFQYAGLGRKFMDVSYYPVVEPDGSVSGVVVNASDITEQHEAEAALRQAKEELEQRVMERTAELGAANARLEREIAEHRRSEARYRAIVEDQTELVCRFRADGVLTFVNEAYCRYFDKRCEELIGQSFMPLIPEEDQPLVEKNFRSLCLERPFYTHQHRVLLPSGDIRWQEWNDLAIFDDAGQLVEYQAVGQDITERRQMEDALRQARKAAEAGSLAKSAFLANMSHEVRTPLSAIIGFAQILQDGTVGAVTTDQHECLGEIVGSSHQLLGLIDDILDLSLLEVDGKEVVSEECDLALLLANWLESFEGKAGAKNLSLSLDAGQGVGMMVTDSRILRKVVTKLLENALKYTPADGRVGIDMDRKGDEVQVTVWDTGIGINEEQLGLLFQPFQQGEEYLNKEYQGVGLGLVLCKRFLELLGGRIEVESTPGQGSRFTFFLPVMAGDR